MSTDTAILNLTWAHLMVEELARCGVRCVSLCPGSRNAPLAIAAAGNGAVRTVVHYDERGAAFYALGWARATGDPAVWITTSGSAVANAHPAVAEADRARVPLLLLTADRPPELRDTGANQATDQVKLFGHHVRWQFDMPCPTADIDQAFVLTTIDEAVARTRSAIPGPVHLNVMFREPLVPAAPATPVRVPPPSLQDWSRGRLPFTRRPGGRRPLDGEQRACVADTLGNAMRPLLVVGQLASDRARRAARTMAHALQWPVIADVASGLRINASDLPVMAHADHLLLGAERDDALAPDAILHVGGAITSKRVQRYLGRHAGAGLVRMQDAPVRLDPDHRVRAALCADIEAACEAVSELAAANRFDDWLAAWRQRDSRAGEAIDAFLESDETLHEPRVARLVSELIPSGQGLFLGNSMPIRDMDIYATAKGACEAVYANRGVSGVDGNVATAAGIAAGRGEPMTALLGDLALLHDLNSLAYAGRSPVPLTIVVVNNDGGGIFSMLPVAAYEQVFESCFGTPHGYDFEPAAAMFGLHYTRPETPDAFRAAYGDALASGKPSLIEVRTDRDENRRVHDALQRQVVEALQKR